MTVETLKKDTETVKNEKHPKLKSRWRRCGNLGGGCVFELYFCVLDDDVHFFCFCRQICTHFFLRISDIFADFLFVCLFTFFRRFCAVLFFVFFRRLCAGFFFLKRFWWTFSIFSELSYFVSDFFDFFLEKFCFRPFFWILTGGATMLKSKKKCLIIERKKRVEVMCKPHKNQFNIDKK